MQSIEEKMTLFLNSLVKEDDRLEGIEHQMWHLVEDIRKLTSAIESIKEQINKHE